MSQPEKVFRCTSCQGIYLDEPVTRCDCQPDNDVPQEYTEWRLVSVADAEAITRLKAALEEIAETANRTATPEQFVAHLQRIARRSLAPPAAQLSDFCSVNYELSPNCPTCHGTGIFQGRKCDGIPF